MTLDIQMKLRNEKNMLFYLKENSYWIKWLNRSNLYYENYKSEMKKKYKINKTDKLIDAIDGIDTIYNILKIIN